MEPDLEKLLYANKVTEIKDGVPTLVEVFGTFCPPCRAQIPHLGHLAKEYEGRLNLVSVSNEDFDTVQRTVQRIPPMKKYNVAVDEAGEVKKLMQKYSVNGIPHAFLFNNEKKLIWHGHPGSGMDEELKRIAP